MTQLLFVLIFLLLFFLVACIDFYHSKTNGIKKFPIPPDANEINSNYNKINLNIALYKNYDHTIAEDFMYPQKDYMETLQKAGWTEIKEEQIGSVHFFEKEEKRVALETEQKHIIFFVVKEKNHSS